MKKIIKVAFVGIFVAIESYGENIDVMSDLSLANVDALASSNEYEPGNE